MISWFFPRGTAIFETAWDHHQCAHCYWWTINLSGWQAIHIFWKVGIFISTFQGLATLPRFFSVAFGHLALHREEQERLQIPSWVLTVATHQKICKEQATTCYVLMPSERWGFIVFVCFSGLLWDALLTLPHTPGWQNRWWKGLWHFTGVKGAKDYLWGLDRFFRNDLKVFGHTALPRFSSSRCLFLQN